MSHDASFLRIGKKWSTALSVAERYAEIVVGLSDIEVAAMWRACLFGRAPLEGWLLAPVAALQALRNDRAALAAEKGRLGTRKAEVAA